MLESPLVQHYIQQAETRGREEGTEQALTAIAIAMLNDNQPIDTIPKYTVLSEEMIEQLTVLFVASP